MNLYYYKIQQLGDKPTPTKIALHAIAFGVNGIPETVQACIKQAPAVPAVISHPAPGINNPGPLAIPQHVAQANTPIVGPVLTYKIEFNITNKRKNKLNLIYLIKVFFKLYIINNKIILLPISLINLNNFFLIILFILINILFINIIYIII